MIFSHCQVVILLFHISLFEHFIFYDRNWSREKTGSRHRIYWSQDWPGISSVAGSACELLIVLPKLPNTGLHHHACFTWCCAPNPLAL